jgi:putative membrane protein
LISYATLPFLNALLNGTAALLLVAGFVFIKHGAVRAHRACMLSAFSVSVAFAISYVIYHAHVGDVRFLGRGLVRPVYFTILISHIALAFVIVPLAIITLRRALAGRFSAHRAIARWTWPIWMYVSVTGVIVYLMVYWLYPHSPIAALPDTPVVAVSSPSLRPR